MKQGLFVESGLRKEIARGKMTHNDWPVPTHALVVDPQEEYRKRRMHYFLDVDPLAHFELYVYGV